MKKILFTSIFVSLIMFCAQTGLCQSIEELNEQFDQEYNAIEPPSATSSVGGDYVFRQTALSTRHTVQMLEVMSRQNQQLISKYDEMMEKYDEIIEQNNEIIRLLSELGKKEGEKK